MPVFWVHGLWMPLINIIIMYILIILAVCSMFLSLFQTEEGEQPQTLAQVLLNSLAVSHTHHMTFDLCLLSPKLASL